MFIDFGILFNSFLSLYICSPCITLLSYLYLFFFVIKKNLGTVVIPTFSTHLGSKVPVSVPQPVVAVDPAEQFQIFEAELGIQSRASPVTVNSEIAIVDRDELEVVPDGQTPPLSAAFQNPLRETHIFTPIKDPNVTGQDVQVEEAISVDSTHRIVVKEYRDVEYDPQQFLSGIQTGNFNEISNLDEMQKSQDSVLKETKAVESEDDEFTDFQSVPAGQSFPPAQNNNPLPLLSVQSLPMFLTSSNTSSSSGSAFKESASHQSAAINPVKTIASSIQSDILIPESVKSDSRQQYSQFGNSFAEIKWPDNSERDIDKSELDRIDEIFARKPAPANKALDPGMNSISLSVKSLGPIVSNQTKDDEWTDFISGDIKTVEGAKKHEEDDDDWTEFVSNNTSNSNRPPQYPNFAPWSTAGTSANQFQNHSMFQTPLTSNGPTFNHRSDILPNTDFAAPNKPFFISSVSSGFNLNRVNQKK